MSESDRIIQKSKIISAKDIVKKYNITYQTVNHYTDLGLLPVLMKKGNVRFYDSEVVDRNLKQIEEFKKEGYSLRLIRKKLIGI
ncbi:MAG: helix-turn-helix domain-containing protein [Candidatus Omnitrophica bacterium]|nr:helix-turn-helix domain-containing protein [Candidatus Omnitrophota bacterium]